MNDRDKRARDLDDRAVARAERLDPEDDSLTARQIRETAASIRDHREGGRA